MPEVDQAPASRPCRRCKASKTVADYPAKGRVCKACCADLEAERRLKANRASAAKGRRVLRKAERLFLPLKAETDRCRNQIEKRLAKSSDRIGMVLDGATAQDRETILRDVNRELREILRRTLLELERAAIRMAPFHADYVAALDAVTKAEQIVADGEYDVKERKMLMLRRANPG